MTKTLALTARPPSRAPSAIITVPLLGACLLAGTGQSDLALRTLAALQVAAPAVSRTAPLATGAAPPFVLTGVTPAERQRAVRCLTDAIYYEAGTEPLEGQRAVAQVVLNRVRDPNFPKTVCGVVYEGWRRRTGCQFSFACDGSIRRRPAEKAIWDRLRPIAVEALDGYVVPEVGAATHYYATYVQPYWLKSVDPVAQIGQQVFCAWKGRAGQVSALTARYQGDELAVSPEALEGGPAPTRPHRRLAAGRLRIAAQARRDWRA